MKRYFEAVKILNQLRFAWLKNLLAVSTGSLALLVALRPKDQVPAPEKYFLVACWIFLGVAILAGFAATYGEVALAKKAVSQIHDRLELAHLRGENLSDIETSFVTTDGLWIQSRRVMILSLMGAVISLVIYAVMDTL